MKLARLLTILVLTFYCGNAAAQFNISRRPSEVGARELVDTLRIRTETGDLSIDYTNQAYLDALRRKRKRERNNVEFQAKLEMSQAGFSNWAGGGDNTFSGIGNIFFRHQHIRKRFSTDSKFEARYGMNYIEGEKFKNIDEFKIYEGLAWKISERWSYSASGNLRSQFTTGYKSRTDDTRVSTFMAPGFLDLAVGFTYTNKPFNIQISPIGGSAIFLLDKELREQEKGAHGVPGGAYSKWQAGPSVRANVDYEFFKKVFRVRSELYSFSNIKNPPVVRWETTFEIRATKFLTTTLYGLAYYDKRSTSKDEEFDATSIQYKYSLGLGLVYTFKNK